MGLAKLGWGHRKEEMRDNCRPAVPSGAWLCPPSDNFPAESQESRSDLLHVCTDMHRPLKCILGGSTLWAGFKLTHLPLPLNLLPAIAVWPAGTPGSQEHLNLIFPSSYPFLCPSSPSASVHLPYPFHKGWLYLGLVLAGQSLPATPAAWHQPRQKFCLSPTHPTWETQAKASSWSSTSRGFPRMSEFIAK